MPTRQKTRIQEVGFETHLTAWQGQVIASIMASFACPSASMPSPKPGLRGLYLRLQGCAGDPCLAAVLLTPQGAVDLPPIPIPLDQLRHRLERWQRTLRFHYIVNAPADADQHAVQSTASDLVSDLDLFWRQPGWLPLHHALEQNPGLPLWLEIPPPAWCHAPAVPSPGPRRSTALGTSATAAAADLARAFHHSQPAAWAGTATLATEMAAAKAAASHRPQSGP